MLTIMKNDLNRLLQQKMSMIVSIGLAIASIILAVVLTSKLQPKLQLAVTGEVPALEQNDSISVTKLADEPKESELVQGRYDALISFHTDGTYEIKTSKSNEFKDNLEKVLRGENISTSELSGQKRQIGTNIVGYMMMFIMMQGVAYSRFFVEDKEKKQISRIVCSSIKFRSYVMGHALFTWLFIFVPTFLIIAIFSLTGINIGFALWQYALIIAVMAMLATSFAIFIDSLFDNTDSANMIANTFIVLTTLLAGSFYDMSSGSLMSKVLYIIPQKDIVTFVENWENSGLSRQNAYSFCYLILFIVVFFGFGVLKTRKDYIYQQH